MKSSVAVEAVVFASIWTAQQLFCAATIAAVRLANCLAINTCGWVKPCLAPGGNGKFYNERAERVYLYLNQSLPAFVVPGYAIARR